ncbi:MAG TPA: DegV family protein [Candidatus Limicola stercorigallinarum]|nr:DegV family protein [Candidatus Limicola stercorigallinarum]
MSWAIVADSSCNLRDYKPQAPDTTYCFAPLKINIAGVEYADDAQLDVDELNRKVAEETSASSSACPSVGEWSDLFRSADNVIAITISANLSGSYEAACMAQQLVEEEGGHRIYVLNSRAAGGKLELLVELLDRYLTKNPTFDEAVAYIQSIEQNSTVLFSLSSYENLTKSGRMPKMAGMIASKLNIRILGIASDEGTIKILGPTRGQKKMLTKVIQSMRENGYTGGIVYIDHVDNEKDAEELAQRIKEQWPTAQPRVIPCGGLCSYYAERDGLIIGFAWPTEEDRYFTIEE